MSEKKRHEKHKRIPEKWRVMRREVRAKKYQADTAGNPNDRPSWLQPLRRFGYKNVQKGPGSDMI